MYFNAIDESRIVHTVMTYTLCITHTHAHTGYMRWASLTTSTYDCSDFQGLCNPPTHIVCYSTSKCVVYVSTYSTCAHAHLTYFCSERRPPERMSSASRIFCIRIHTHECVDVGLLFCTIVFHSWHIVRIAFAQLLCVLLVYNEQA